MYKCLIIIVFGIIVASLTGCSIKTPEIQGFVLDEETKQPVEEAWITATLGIKAKTVAGNVHKYLSVEMPHTRTDKLGKFIIPPRSFKKPSFPIGFGTDVESFGVGASTLDDKGGSLSLMEFLGKGRVDVTIHIKPDHSKDTEGEYFTYLQGLHNYCLTGRFYAEVPPVEGGFDKWELNYAIIKHERFLKRLEEPGSSEQKARYSNTLSQLGYLYEKKGDFEKAITIYRKLMEFEGIGGWFYKSSENRIKELQEKMQKK
jgi:hypothetical protein